MYGAHEMASSSNKELESVFPGLSSTAYKITSKFDPKYNCIAWAAGDSNKWWEPDPMGQYYWPDNAPRDYNISSYQKAYEAIGFVLSEETSANPESTTIALFSKDGQGSHASRQIADDEWTSKLGKNVDISHSLRALCGKCYGVVSIFMRITK